MNLGQCIILMTHCTVIVHTIQNNRKFSFHMFTQKSERSTTGDTPSPGSFVTSFFLPVKLPVTHAACRPINTHTNCTLDSEAAGEVYSQNTWLSTEPPACCTCMYSMYSMYRYIYMYLYMQACTGWIVEVAWCSIFLFLFFTCIVGRKVTTTCIVGWWWLINYLLAINGFEMIHPHLYNTIFYTN